MTKDPHAWPLAETQRISTAPKAESEICLVTHTYLPVTLIPLSQLPLFQHVTAWIQRFVQNCWFSKKNTTELEASAHAHSLTVLYLVTAMGLLIRFSQRCAFSDEVASL